MLARLCFRRGMPSDTLDDIELRTVQFQTPAIRTLNRSDFEGVEEVIVETDRGTVLVAIQGDRRKPAIVSYHDIGLNCEYHKSIWGPTYSNNCEKTHKNMQK